MKPELTLDLLCQTAAQFAAAESRHQEPALYGVTDGKAVGTYFEHKFQEHLHSLYQYKAGSSAKGIDFPDLHLDLKVTSIKQPQSSCPFRSARQKIYGLGYSLLLFVYDKVDDPVSQTGRLHILHTLYIDQTRTADYQTTAGILRLLENDANLDDLIAFIHERYLPVDEIQAERLAQEILDDPPQMGYLTISNALQWRLQYRRVIQEAGAVDGILRVS
jgi:hypothetical protein